MGIPISDTLLVIPSLGLTESQQLPEYQLSMWMVTHRVSVGYNQRS